MLKPNVVNYRDYQKFRSDEFKAEFDSEMLKHDINNMEYQYFFGISVEILSKHTPMKQKYLRANQGRFLTKNVLQAIMNRSGLRNNYLSDRTEMSQKEYKNY